MSILASNVRPIEEASLVNVYMEQEQSFTDLHKLKDILNTFRGDDPVLLHFPRGKQIKPCWLDASFG